MWSIDERDGEICRFVRERRNKQQAVEIATLVYGITHDKIVHLLQREGLMDQSGNYIEPIRLTGKEHTMERKKPDYYWSAKRKQLLQELYQSGQEAPAIAEQLGTTTPVIYDAIAKFNVSRAKQSAAAPSQEPSTVTAPPTGQTPPADPPATQPTVPAKHSPKPEPWINEYNLRELNRLISEAVTQAQDAPTLFLKDQCYEAFMAIGKLNLLLRDAQQILRKVFPRSSRPLNTHSEP